MELNEFNNKIAENELKVNDLKIKLEELNNIIVNEMRNYIECKYQKDIESNVRENTKNTKRLGIENLRLLKQDVNELIETIPLLIQKYIDSSTNFWEYNNYIISDNEFNQKYNLKYQIKGNIRKVTDNLYAHLGFILIKYGYSEYGRYWVKQYDSDIPKCNYGHVVSGQLDKISDEYIVIFEKFHDSLVELNKLKKDKEEYEAIDLWERA